MSGSDESESLSMNHLPDTAQAEAGAKLNSLCVYAGQHGFKGMNFAIGIPGSVGGSIMMNAGTHLGSMQDVISAISVLSTEGQKRRIRKVDLSFGYRLLDWNHELQKIYGRAPIIWAGEFSLQISDRQTIQAEAETILKNRRSRQPAYRPSAGCFFKNPSGPKTAGELIDAAGLKGKQIGGAQVSTEHANFILNTGLATAADIMALKDLIQETVFQLFDIYLETEVQIVGS